MSEEKMSELRGQPIEALREAKTRRDMQPSKWHWLRVRNENYARSLYPDVHVHCGNVWRSAKVSEAHYIIAETHLSQYPGGLLTYRLGYVTEGKHQCLSEWHSLNQAKVEANRHSITKEQTQAWADKS